MGVDIAKSYLDGALGNEKRRFANERIGHRELIRWVKQVKAPMQVICESSGGYERTLVQALVGAQLKVSLVQANRVRQFARAAGILAKTDRIDAKVLCDFAKVMQPGTISASQLEQQHLRELESQRRHLTHLLVMEQNRAARASDRCVQRLNRSLLNQIKKQIQQLDLHPRVLDLFLQILDAARVTMASGETLDLSGFYIVFTSNLAAVEILNLQHSSFATMERHVLAKAQQSLRPELYARITEKLVFMRLNYHVQMEIARLHIGRELSFLESKGFTLIVGHAVISFLMQRGFHPRLGARPLRDTIEKHLRGAIANALLAGTRSGRLEFVVSGNDLALRPC